MHHDEIVEELLQFIYDSNPLADDARPLPLDKSLYDLGILDSFAIVELVSFIEKNWEIRILDSELTKEKFGGVSKMARLISEKLEPKKANGSVATETCDPDWSAAGESSPTAG